MNIFSNIKANYYAYGTFETLRLIALSMTIHAYSQLKKLSLAKCGEKFYAGYSLTIMGGKNISIGDNFRATGRCYIYGNDGKITIGNNLKINSNVQIGASGGVILIGDDVSFGPNVVLRAADHGVDPDELMNRQPHSGGVIIVEDDVWVGANAVILKNVRLKRGTVVAAGAVVTRDTEPYSIVGGVPAKKIAARF